MLKYFFLTLAVLPLITSFYRIEPNPAPMNQQDDLLIINASIIDGSGSAAFFGHILIHDGRITQIGDFEYTPELAARVIDAGGLTVSPGFIDPHSHGDPFDTPRFDNFLSMGVTTITLGQDGNSPGIEDLPGWMNRVDALGTGPNIVHFTGHNTLRRTVQAPRESPLDANYISEMKRILKESLESGSFGLSTGLEYDHGIFSDLDELVELGKTVSSAGRMVMSHVRNEDDDQIKKSVRELIQQGRDSGAAVHVSHIKIVYANEPERADEVLLLLDEARNAGVMITADVYPYVASYTGINILFPEWALPPHDFDDVLANRKDELEEYLRDRVLSRNGPDATLFGTAPWSGKTLAEIADVLEKPFERVLIEDIGPGGASAAYFVMNEEVMRQFLKDPMVVVSSDGSPTMRHPRGYGSFAKILRKYVKEENLLTLEEAIHKMSGLTAQLTGLSDQQISATPRGILKEGYAADLLIFDPSHVLDRATFEDPHQLATGFEWVVVNGVPVIENGERNETRPGRVIRANTVNATDCKSAE